MERAVMDDAVQWQVHVSQNTDAEAREYLQSHGLDESHVSSLVEDAIQMYLFQQSVLDEARGNDDLSSEQLQELADETVRSVRREMYQHNA